MNFAHLDALEYRLYNEKQRAVSDPSPLRDVWIKGIEREIASERRFLGLAPFLVDSAPDDDALLAALGA